LGKGQVLYLIESSSPESIQETSEEFQQLVWVGLDDRGVELEIVALVLPEYILVIHVMPTSFSKEVKVVSKVKKKI
jgi:hypothetical protein